MMIAENTSKRRGWSKGNAQRLDYPLNSIVGYGREYFIHELKQLLEMERGKLGYYPPLEGVYSLIERQFGTKFARESRSIGLVSRLNRAGLHYSASVAAEYHEQRAEVNPLLDVNEPYPLPWGTVFHYITWKLPRMIEGDSFRLDCLTFERLEDYRFSVRGRGVDLDITGRCPAELTARVLMALRSTAQVVVSEEPVSAVLPPFKRRRWLKPAPVPAPAPVKPAPVPEPVRVSDVKLDRHKPLPMAAGPLGPLPVLTYTRKWEMEAIAERYLEQGYSMAAIQAALKRSDLANEGQSDVQ